MSSRIGRRGLVVLMGWGLLASGHLGADESSDLEDLRWLEGHWCVEEVGSVSEEIWTSPAGGTMIGLNRQVRAGGAEYEYLRIEATPEGIDYVAIPSGTTSTRFRMVRSGEKSAVFHNAEHDWPQVIEYRIDEEGRLQIRVAGLREGSHQLAWTMHGDC